MGNNSSSQRKEQNDQIYKEYKEIRKETNGVILAHLQTNQTYFLRQVNFINKRDYQKEMERLEKQLTKEQNQNIIKIVKFWGKQFNNFCSNSFKVYSVYQCPQITLLDEIKARQKQSRYFQECDLWSILQSCTNALPDLKSTLSLQPSKIYILPDGLLKIAHNDMTDDQYRCIINESIYYAPQKISNFNKPDRPSSLQKQVTFSMGMTLLHASLLEDLYDCYDFKNHVFNQDHLEKCLQSLSARYSQRYIQALATILEPNPNRRPSLVEIQDILNEKWLIQDHQNQQSVKNQRQTDIMKESKNINESKISKSNIQSKVQILKQKSQQKQKENQQIQSIESSVQQGRFSVTPLEDTRNYSIGYSNRFSYEPIPYNSYIPSTFQNRQNIFTDPKLLEMIRRDLQDIHSMKRQTQFYDTPLIDYSKNTIETKIATVEPIPQHTANFSDKSFQKPKNNSTLVFTTQKYENGNIYEGTMLNGVKEGTGKLTYPDGAYYEGQYKNDLMCGEGCLYYEKDKPAYDGNWLDDQFHGKGILYNQSPILFDGCFDFEDFSKAEDYWVRYQGDFLNDNKCGKGRLVLSNGQIFQGEFDKDCIHGQGVFTNSQGATIHGIWENNILVQVYQSD